MQTRVSEAANDQLDDRIGVIRMKGTMTAIERKEERTGCRRDRDERIEGLAFPASKISLLE